MSDEQALDRLYQAAKARLDELHLTQAQYDTALYNWEDLGSDGYRAQLLFVATAPETQVIAWITSNCGG